MEVLVTGGAGFIGSSLVDSLVQQGHHVRVLDDLSTGYAENVADEVRVITGDIADEAVVREAVDGTEVIFHQAAHKAVLRSVEQPLTTDRANTHGTLTLLQAALEAGVRRVINASSSSVYGGAPVLPTSERQEVLPRSPYAVSKLAGEHYCRVYAELHGLETIVLRYFNVYGPRQRADSTYAAVIPLFIDALRRAEVPIVHGDGLQSRDFTYIGDVVEANLAAMAAPAEVCNGRTYNIAAGVDHSLLDLLQLLAEIIGTRGKPLFVGERPGDVRHSRADVTAARRELKWEALVPLEDGLRRTVAWFASSSRVS